MKKQHTITIGTSILMLSAVVSFGEVKVAFESNNNETATPQFKFKNIPAPATNDAAAKATFKLVSGEADGNSGEFTVLNDGKLPTEEDQPAENCFFTDDSEGGRVQADLGSVIAIKQVNTYSWHTSTRAPQLYKLYASDGTAADFKAQPENGVNPETVGWKLIAKVDTRPTDGDSGGQYGVSISDTEGSLGKFRYLLFDCARTESDDSYGNTFYSELDVVAADCAAPATAVATPVPLNSVFNLEGISKDEAEFTGGLDDLGFCCSANLLGTKQVWNGTTFNIGAAGGSNVVTCTGQTVTLPAGQFASLRMLALAVNGNQETQAFTVAYDDGSQVKIEQSISDWFTPENYPSEAQVVNMAHRNQADGTMDEQTFNLYGYTLNLDKTHGVKTVTLPDNINVKVFALTLVP